MRVIPSNTATAALRRIPFTLVDATDLYTPEDITVTGVKVSLNIDGGTPANSTNDIVKVAGSTGEYYIELTQSEANQTAGALIRGTLMPTGCALSKLEAQIGPAEVFAATVALADGGITAAKFADDAITAAKIATGALTADAFAADALVAATFATDSITADALAADALTEIQASAQAALTASHLNPTNGLTRIAGVPLGEGGVAPGSPIGEVAP